MECTNTLCVTNIPSECLLDDHFKECLLAEFSRYGDICHVAWLPSFRRCLIVYEYDKSARDARMHLNGKELQGTVLKIFFGSPTVVHNLYDSTDSLLQLPEHEKMFLISPPVSPPVGWVQAKEEQPNTYAHGHLEIDRLVSALNTHVMSQTQVPLDADGPSVVIFKPDPINEDLPTIIVENVDENEADLSVNIGPVASAPRTRLPSR
ncbi:hypothetical protein MP638_001497 [Amoeboaphelidium occidentale]|nr:hypothetical protein MP638_001497 [Amoeboaphelidium occidentale]